VVIKFNDSLKFLPYNFISAGASLLVTIERHDSLLHLRICQQRENINPHVFLLVSERCKSVVGKQTECSFTSAPLL